MNIPWPWSSSVEVISVPAVFLVGPDGRVRFQYVNPDYKVRLDPHVLIAAAEAYRD